MGLALGVGAILLWSFTASLVCLGADEMGPWHFVAVTMLIGGVVQLAFCRGYRGELRSCLALPGRLWLVTLFGFVFYMIAYPLALAVARGEPARCGVNLINYLWPPLTVVFALLWVPSTRPRPGLVVALVLAVAGTGLANLGSLGELWRGVGSGSAADRSSVPYLLALAAAVAWAVYSSLLSRWKAWARNYTTSAIGLIITGLIAGIIAATCEGASPGITLKGAVVAVLCGIGPQGGGYLLWELALARAEVKTLGLLGAMTPILSTVWLCLALRFVPGVELIAAAVLVSGGIVLSRRG
ncbi:MAG: EamA family transporter [Phycisphaerae bacterium]|nr:EamA family transporter [Phycisphaerae bacterium]